MKKNQTENEQQLIREIADLRLRIAELEPFQTGYMRMKQELHHLASVQSLILNNSIMGIAFVRHRVFEWVNPRLADLFGTTQALIQGAGARFAYASDRDFEDYGRKIYEALKLGNGFEFEYVVPRKDGKTFIGRIIGNALDTSRPHEGSIWILEDVSERKKAVTALKESEAKYRLVVDNSYDLIWTIDGEGRFTYASPSWKKAVGYPASSVVGKRFHPYVYADDVVRCTRMLLESIDGKKEMQGLEYRVKHADGVWHWHEASGTPVFAPDGVFLSFVGVSRDISDRKQAEEALKQSQSRLSGIIEFLPDAAVVIDRRGEIIAWNRAMEEMTGIVKERVLGRQNCANATSFYGEKRKYLLDLIGCSDRELESLYTYVKRKGNTIYAEAFAPALHGGKGGHIFAAAAPLFDNRGNRFGVIELIRDVTEKRRLELQLRQAQKMEAIGTLAGGIAHDFNNILASMIGFTEMAAKESRPDVRQKYHDRVLQACARAKNLISQILSFSRTQEQEMRPLEVKFILKEALHLLRATLPSTIDIKHDMVRDDTRVCADPTQIHQIVINLCTNAAHAMREKGGILHIRLATAEIQRPEFFAHSDLPAGAYVALSVSDTGHGIDPAVKDKIFDPFFTTKSAGEGTGLGLSVVYGIVKHCGGAIDVQSEAGRGATFTVYLPRIGVECRGEEKRREESDPCGNERILFVDDEESLVALARAYFATRGYRITATVSSTEALELFQADPGRFDLVITDMTMPELTGAELARALSSVRPDLPVILCTGYSDSVSVAQVRALNIREFVLKPVALDELNRLVRRILDC